ncbi:MAG: hypothetical protein OXC55_08505 [Chloroflexi bacterium]|nr:hypothetical protein [Chloroflexota bacterium]
MDALTVQRDRTFIEENYKGEKFRDGTPAKFSTPELPSATTTLTRLTRASCKFIYDAINGMTRARYGKSLLAVLIGAAAWSVGRPFTMSCGAKPPGSL